MEPVSCTIALHGFPVRCEYRSDGTVIYRCPLRTCPFATRYSCHDEDLECRIRTYAELHDHIRGHVEPRGAH